MQKQMQAELQGNRYFLPEVQIQKRCKSVKNRREYDDSG